MTETFWPHHHEGPWRDAPPWAIELREMLCVVIKNQGVSMSQADDLNAAVASLASAFATEHDAVTAELAALAAALAAAPGTDPVLSSAVTQAIANVNHITGSMATDAAALTQSIPAVVTPTPTPSTVAPAVAPTVAAPTIAPVTPSA